MWHYSEYCKAILNLLTFFIVSDSREWNLLFLGKMPDSYEWSDGDKDAIEDANEVWELAMQKDKRPTFCFGINTSLMMKHSPKETLQLTWRIFIHHVFSCVISVITQQFVKNI